jgi:pyruvate dehydrogenase (quinone)
LPNSPVALHWPDAAGSPHSSGGLPGNGGDIEGQWPHASQLSNHVSDISAQSARFPCEDDLRRAADVLNAEKKVAILAGRGALHATAELEMLAEALGAPIIKALLGKATVPDDSPYATGTIGLLGPAPSQEAMEECDTLCIVGSSFHTSNFFRSPVRLAASKSDLDPTCIGIASQIA